MPLSFKKFFTPSASSRSKNPYAKNPTANNAQYQHKHSSTPDLLAEARQAAGRDPVTGRKVGGAGAGAAAGASGGSASSSPGLRESRSAYGDMGRGTTYDEFVREMRASSGGGAGGGSGSGSGNEGGAGAPLGGYYAPAPKMAVEYYAPERGFR
ncbi:hypothetical protein BU24DRAFT_419526 [Aaosphaeria arxii CBS 175.79]|uniref:Uncharacterized protein n=1 Tax=Aaosphaeria arxii CBS 175.79 TaxID=1450172 RepID=A0A6A5Y2Z5_9PLEO|nr:uncharacterized protein BU24DRAFT_419526 [Aaosphaeria arxii CBS 175.79]KAF2019925.1 hypothetical protein BU24DRAFT_419526 [Aaosphaeria arxii CBS 175.79]